MKLKHYTEKEINNIIREQVDEIIEKEGALWERLQTSVELIPAATTNTDKLVGTLIKVFKRLPPQDLDILLDKRNICFVFPDANFVRCEHGIPTGHISWRIYLVSTLALQPQDEMIYTIAHELAHVFLEHGKCGFSGNELEEAEREAHLQVVKWGFEKEAGAAQTKECP